METDIQFFQSLSYFQLQPNALGMKKMKWKCVQRPNYTFTYGFRTVQDNGRILMKIVTTAVYCFLLYAKQNGLTTFYPLIRENV